VAKVWDWEAEEQVFAFGSSSNRAGGIAFHPSGGQLAAVMGTNGVWVWATTNWGPNPVGTDSTPSRSPLVGMRSTASPIPSGTEWNPSLPGSADAARSERDRPLFTFRPQGGEVTTLAYSPNGQRLVTGGADGTVVVWESATGQQVSRLETTNQPIRRVAVSPDGQRLVAVAERTAWVWDLQSGRLIRAFPDDNLHQAPNDARSVPTNPEGISPAPLVPEGRRMVAGCQSPGRRPTNPNRPGRAVERRRIRIPKRSTGPASASG
jgi:WD40 repeat protein